MYSSAGRPYGEGRNITVSVKLRKKFIMTPVVTFSNDEQLVSMQYTRERRQTKNFKVDKAILYFMCFNMSID